MNSWAYEQLAIARHLKIFFFETKLGVFADLSFYAVKLTLCSGQGLKLHELLEYREKLITMRSSVVYLSAS